jgi:4'-phosphopantetheinyl transferase
LELYVFQGDHKNKSEKLLKKAIELYVKEKSTEIADSNWFDFTDLELKKTKSGKPYFEGNPLYFSISHTEEIWSCLIHHENVGLDIQKKKKTNFEKLANRFFLDEEIKFVRDNGDDGFFDIWVRKEACIKYFGTGIRDIRSFSVVKDGKLAEEINFGDKISFVSAFELSSDVKGAYCCSKKGFDLWIRELK